MAAGKECDGIHQKKAEAPLSFSDDAMFTEVMLAEEIARGVLEAVLGRPVGAIRYHNVQQALFQGLFQKGVRMDVYMEDEGAVYDIEMQSQQQKWLGLRCRYYQSAIDSRLLRIGRDYRKLRSSYVIFVCPEDLLKAGLPVYTFKPGCAEEPTVELDCRQCWKILNAKAWKPSLAQRRSGGIIGDGRIARPFGGCVFRSITSWPPGAIRAAFCLLRVFRRRTAAPSRAAERFPGIVRRLEEDMPFESAQDMDVARAATLKYLLSKGFRGIDEWIRDARLGFVAQNACGECVFVDIVPEGESCLAESNAEDGRAWVEAASAEAEAWLRKRGRNPGSCKARLDQACVSLEGEGDAGIRYVSNAPGLFKG